MSSKGQILVVEDDPGLQQLIARAAERAGFSTIAAHDGATGLALALTRAIDLVLLDINLPALDGRDVLSHLRQDQRTADLPVLICSGRRDEHNRRLALELGAVDFIEKPFDPRDLMAKIGRQIEKMRAHRAELARATASPDALAKRRGRGAPAGVPGKSVEQAVVIGRKLRRSANLTPITPADIRRPLRILLAEDTEDDALLLHRELTRHGFAVTIRRVESRAEMRAALGEREFDLVVSDFSMPNFDALDALATVKESGLDLPIIVLSGTVDEASAVIALKAGAHDFVVKGNLARLVPAVERELREAKSRAERRNMEEQLLVSDRMASVGMLAAGVAHEINNPLAAVIGNLTIVCDLLEPREEAPGELREAAEAAADALHAAERVREIVRDVKMFSRGSEERLVPVDLHRVLDSSVRMAWNEIRHRARVSRHFGAIAPVMGSEQRLGQVFLNLIVNAAQAIPPGNAQDNEIRLTTSMDGDRVMVEVSDTGPGIPPEVLPRLFNAFVTTKLPGEGTGLGLSISRRIVRALGGEIAVRSELGAGATFRVDLPASEADPVEPARDEAPLPGQAPRSRILVVDDEVVVTNTIRRIIGTAHDLVVVFRAQEAFERIRGGERYDLILSDLLMPDMTGMRLHEVLAASVPEQAERMLFMSAGTFTADAAQFLDARPDRLIEKPFDKAHLLAVIEERLRERSP
jgi:DNA-binding response OmpR family regulator